MEKDSEVSNSYQLQKLHFKFISEERLNHIAKKVQYDHRKKLEDEAWQCFLKRRKARITENNQSDQFQCTVYQEKQFPQSSHFLNQHGRQKNAELSVSNTPYSESSNTASALSEDIPTELDIRSVNSQEAIHEHSVKAQLSTVSLTSNNLSENSKPNDDAESRCFLHKTPTSCFKHDSEHSSMEFSPTSAGVPCEADCIKSHKRSSKNIRSLNEVVMRKKYIQESSVNIMHHCILDLGKASLEQLTRIWGKISSHLDMISLVCVKAPDDEDSEECLLLQLRGAEFSSLFARNYVYSLRRKLQELNKLVRVLKDSGYYSKTVKNVQLALIAAHQAAYNALTTYLKRMPHPVVNSVADKLSEVLHLVIDLCTVHYMFGLKPHNAENDPKEVECKCKRMLLQIQDLKNQYCQGIEETIIAHTEQKKTIDQQQNKTRNYYSLSMYKPALQAKPLPPGFRSKIKHLAKVKFDGPPRTYIERQDHAKTNLENKNKNYLTIQNLENKPRKRHTEYQLPRNKHLVTKKRKPLNCARNHMTECMSVNDDDNIPTMVEMFKDEDEEDSSKDTKSLQGINTRTSATEQQMSETRHNVSVVNQVIPIAQTNVWGRRVLKQGPPNAQLIVLPPFHSHDNQKVSTEFLCKEDLEIAGTLFKSQHRTERRHSFSAHSEFQTKSSSVNKYTKPCSSGKHSPRQRAVTKSAAVTLSEKMPAKVQKAVQTSPVSTLQTLHLCAISENLYSQQIENIHSKINNLTTSYAQIIEQLLGLERKQEEALVNQSMPLSEEQSDVRLSVTDEQVSEVGKYSNEYKQLLESATVRGKQWKVINNLSNELVNTALRSVVEELDFHTLLSEMFRLEFQ